ncbi:hypothetical protein [Tropicibacter alexandrii]|uniref:hypothetical protein n=1 Tax=Tropicibacter alexandrii TaxID=2267683 RepID=UPI00100896A0|nr:hypothetical protein [Tropicibacter alexandrii]
MTIGISKIAKVLDQIKVWMAEGDDVRIIDLNRSGAQRFDDANKVLQNEAFDQLSKIISAQLDRLEDSGFTTQSATELSYPRPHEGILIEGGRGSGKTTFLLNALHDLSSANDGWAAGMYRRLHVLPVIDPTLIETKEHIIIVIISLIDAALDKLTLDADQQSVDQARSEMAEGLGLLDGIGKSSLYGDEWEDPAWIMSRGLRKAAKGRTFEIKLRKYIGEALKVLNKKAFVLAFDDVDTNFQHGHSILETIRKYLASPQLILMISGDLELYGRLVRRNIYETFGEGVMKHDPKVIGEDKTGLSDAVRELEEQYLLKIVPPQNRIAMLPLSGILQTVDPSEVLVEPIGNEDQQELVTWASKKIRKQLLEADSIDGRAQPPHPFFNVVSREHLRLLIGYLRALGDPDQGASRRGVFAVFETRLRAAGLQSELFSHANLDDSLQRAFRWLVAQDKPTSLIRFGVPSDTEKAIILHCFALSIAPNLHKSPSGCMRALFALNLPISMMQRERYAMPDVRKSIFDFIWEDASPDLLEVAGRLGSISRSGKDEEGANIGNLRASSFGSVGTMRDVRGNRFSRLFDFTQEQVKAGAKKIKDVDEVVRNQTSNFSNSKWVRSLASEGERAELSAEKGILWFPLEDLEARSGQFKNVLGLATFDRFSSRGEQFRSISALSLFAAIGELLARDDVSDLGSMAPTSIMPAFMPDAKVAREGSVDVSSTSADEEDDNNDEIETEDENSEYTAFLKNLQAWHEFASANSEHAALSPAMLARVSERIHDQLIALDEAVKVDWKTGHILHRQITNILHALLVVSSGWSGRLDSPKTSDRPFVEGLQRAAADDARRFHSLAAIVISCPLVWVFLNPEESYKQSGTNLQFLRNEVEKALTTWQEARGSKEATFNPEWLKAPEIEIAIGRSIKRNSQRTLPQNGFYDVLNVVPCYSPKSGTSK